MGEMEGTGVDPIMKGQKNKNVYGREPVKLLLIIGDDGLSSPNGSLSRFPDDASKLLPSKSDGRNARRTRLLWRHR
jgi:hypothetical protein